MPWHRGDEQHSTGLLLRVSRSVAGAFSMASGGVDLDPVAAELYENELRIEQEELRAFPERNATNSR